jgi:4-amino-4-deoxy-L-arabinose transferase-like glycosyltransferase
MNALAGDRFSMRWGWILIFALAVYFVLQVLVRVVYAPALGLDEAELMVTTQAWAAGYGAQPPLYSWLQRLVFDLIGPGIPALALLKNLLLFLTCLFMYGVGRIVLRSDGKAALATLALFTIPQLAFESQRSLSHTVIAVAAAAAAVYAFLLLIRDGRLSAYLAFGLCIALGMLSKYNFIVLPLALVAAALSLPAFRPRVLDWRMLAAVLFALILLAPHALWLPDHLSLALSKVEKFDMATGDGLFASWAKGLAALAAAAVNYAGVALAAFLLASFVPFRRRPADAPAGAGTLSTDPFARLIFRTLWIAGAAIVIAVLASRARHVPDRWLHPVFFLLPLALFILLDRRLSGARARILAAISIAIAVLCPVGLVLFHFFPDDFGRAPHENAPFAALASEIEARGLAHDYIIAHSTYIAGNLKYRFPEATVAEPEYGLWPPSGGRQPNRILLASKTEQTSPPDGLYSLLAGLCGSGSKPLDLASLRGIPLTGRYLRMQARDYTLYVASIPACAPLPASR